jgi:hypothetical protein
MRFSPPDTNWGERIGFDREKQFKNLLFRIGWRIYSGLQASQWWGQLKRKYRPREHGSSGRFTYRYGRANPSPGTDHHLGAMEGDASES